MTKSMSCLRIMEPLSEKIPQWTKTYTLIGAAEAGQHLVVKQMLLRWRMRPGRENLMESVFLERLDARVLRILRVHGGCARRLTKEDVRNVIFDCAEHNKTDRSAKAVKTLRELLRWELLAKE